MDIHNKNKEGEKMNCTTPEEMIIMLINQNRGTKNFIDKSRLIELALENGIEVMSLS